MENNFEIKAAAVSDRGLSEKRPQNEDSFLLQEDRGIFAVADGVGGAQAGDVASQMAVEILSEAFSNLPPGADPEDVMRAAIERANQAIYQMARELPQLSSMATTIAAVHIAGNIATIGHVGDSRVYKIGANGDLYRETTDHSLVEEEVRAGRMTEEQALTHPGRNVISRAVGAESSIDVELKTIMVEPGTSFLLCSDGITRHVSDQEIARAMSTGMEPGLICEHLKELCYERGAEDNLTAVVVEIPSSTAAVATAGVGNPGYGTGRDAEEDTIATARSPFVETAEHYIPETPAKSVEKEARDDESYLIEEQLSAPAIEEKASAEEYSSSSVVVPPRPVTDDKEFRIFSTGAEPKVVHEASSRSGASTAFIAIICLLIGIATGGFGAYYFFNTPAEEAVREEERPLVPISNDIQVSALEESRRLVDSDPQAFLNANAATPQDAADHYLLGRALLLTGKYFEAKRQFGLAKEKLKDADPKEMRTLAAEIAMATSIIESGPATESFKRELAAGSSESGTQTNTNVANSGNTGNGR